MAAQSETAPAGESRAARWKQQAREIAILLLVILFIKGCVIDQYSIPSGSMEPTLHGHPNMFKGDRVLTNKMYFGPRIPFTAIRLWNWWEPDRWDIVVFKPPAGGSEHPRLIKRVVGLPGERVELRGGEVYINGEKIPLGETMPDDFKGYWGYEDVERAAEQAPHAEQRMALAQMLQQFPPKYGSLPGDEYQLVPEDHYFLLGDNSLNSVDGRMYGWVPRNHLYGRASAVIWPIGHWRDFTGFSHTWWGKLLLYGIPIALIAFEAHHWRRDRQAKAAGDTGS
ncbi:MAG: signal peptidase I [Candidatus Hydrogenedentes bacterium]|nr:signal peptidase I [Candidatus Hydrogenedentota bacterium]